MSSLRVVCILLCLVVFNIRDAVSGTVDLWRSYAKANAGEQNDWRPILSSIESRLKNLDFLYTSQLTPTLETRLEHFQNRISGMEVKLLRVEALLTNKLDRMSDNISSRHFRDDMVQTDMFKKIETAYDGIIHRVAYMDRKTDNGFLKLQEKSEAISKKLDGMSDALTDKYDSIESQLSDLVEGMEDMSISFHNASNKQAKISYQHDNVNRRQQQEMQDISGTYFPQDFTKEAKAICENSSKNLESLKEEFNNFTQSNSTGQSINRLSENLEKLLNDYASKVSDIGAQVTTSEQNIATHLGIIEKVLNSSKTEMQNGLRVLMVQVGKISPKQNVRNDETDQKLLSDVAQKLDANFEKVISSQNTFLESCHRLQMDESQLEGQISDILNKLIDNFEGTTKEHHHLLRKIEGLLVKHDIQMKKESHQASANIMTVYEQSKKESKDTKEQFKQITDNLEALFALVQSILGDGKGISKRGISKQKELIEYIQSLERALNFTKYQQMEMFDSYKATIETLLTITQTKREDEHSSVIIMNNLTQSVTLLKEHLNALSEKFNTNITVNIMNSVEKIFELVKKNSENLIKISQSTNIQDNNRTNKLKEETIKPMKKISKNLNRTNDNSDLDSLIREIFFTNNSHPITTTTTEDPCLDVDIDVRFDNGNNLNNAGSTKKCQKVHASEGNIIFPSAESETNDTDCLDIPIDPRFDQTSTKKHKRCKSMKSEIQESEVQIMKNTTANGTIDSSQLIQEMIPFLNLTDNTVQIDVNRQ